MAGDDVARGAALDQADVGGRLLVEPAQLHPRDRRRGGGDRAAAVLGPDPGVRLDPGEVGEDLLLGRASRRSPRRPAPAWSRTKPQSERSCRGVEGLRPAQALLLGDGQHQLDPDRRRLRPAWRATSSMKTATAALLSAPRIVSPRLRKTPSSFDHLDLAPVRDRVEVGAEHHPLLAAARQPREQVAGARFGRPGGVVLAHLEAQRPQLGGDRVGDLALLARRAADLAEPDERLVQALSTAKQASREARGLSRSGGR